MTEFNDFYFWSSHHPITSFGSSSDPSIFIQRPTDGPHNAGKVDSYIIGVAADSWTDGLLTVMNRLRALLPIEDFELDSATSTRTGRAEEGLPNLALIQVLVRSTPGYFNLIRGEFPVCLVETAWAHEGDTPKNWNV